MNDGRKELLVDFSKHVPKLLHHQLISEQAQQYIQSENAGESSFHLTPSIQRFHGALLFVDISGFTNLSQKLDVESLKNHINGYFTKIIEVVDKWGGDVVKFAGDALYVVWRTHSKPPSPSHVSSRSHASDGSKTTSSGVKASLSGSFASTRTSVMASSTTNNEFRDSASLVTEKAIRCGLEICETCGNFPVFSEAKLSPMGRESKKFHQKISSLVSSIASKIVSRASMQTSEAISYLNVHCGVSVGLMAGLDVGYDDRWEYFLVGEALADVAKAESLAEKGDVVVSTVAHELYHGEDKFPVKRDQVPPKGVLPCGCSLMGGNCYKVQSSNTLAVVARSTSTESVRDRNKVRRSRTNGSLENIKLLENLSNEVKSALSLIATALKREYVAAAAAYVRSHQVPDMEGMSVSQKVKRVEKQLPSFIISHVRRHFSQWLESRLIDHLARHVHDVARADYAMSCNIAQPFRALLHEFLTQTRQGIRSPTEAGRRKAPTSTAIVAITESNEMNELDDIFDPDVIFKSDQSPSLKERLNSKVEAELRTVTVMFINIESFDMSLLIDMSRYKEGKRPAFSRFDSIFGFLERTENEQMADQLILEKVQKCLEILHRNIYRYGGQLRQFIVDDKGTVGIASFGLRGSVNEDNAANAVEAANAIVDGLLDLGLSASIGITTGKVYCGLVGSLLRHEFAIMGPSVNLSARLMSKAGANSILCDQETTTRDRTHEYQHSGDMQAKGYDSLVSTYRPLFASEGEDRSHFGRAVSFASLSHLLHRGNSRSSLSSDAHGPPTNGGLSLSHLLMPSLGSHPSLIASFFQSNRKVTKLLTADFMITDEITTIVQESSTVTSEKTGPLSSIYGYRPLRGRNKEVEMVMHFLFSETGPDASLVSVDTPTKLVTLLGLNGIGKSAIVSSIARKISFVARHDHSINVNVFKTRVNHVSASPRYIICKPIVLEIVRLAKKLMDTSAEAKASIRRGMALQVSARRVLVKADPRQEYTNVVDTIFKQLPEKTQKFKDVVLDMLEVSMTSAKSVSNHTTHAAMPMTQYSLEEYKAAMVLLMNFSVSFSKKVLVVIIEDLQLLDMASLDIIKHVWLQGKGILLLTTTSSTSHTHMDGTAPNRAANNQSSHVHSGKDEAKENDGQAIGHGTTSKAPSDMLALFRSTPHRFLELSLEPLDATATTDLVKDIVKEDVPTAIVDQLVLASGGNPMYAAQLAKTIVEEGVEILGQDHQRAATDIAQLAKMCRRVEEIICYRLDRLEPLVQTILKAATVCALNGRSFTPNLIAFVIRRQIKNIHSLVLNSDKTATSSNNTPFNGGGSPVPAIHTVAHDLQILRDVVIREVTALFRRRDFIQKHGTPVGLEETVTSTAVGIGSNDEDDDFLPDGELGNVEYEFLIPTEQSTIYALIIDEQREFFHGKVAQYYYERQHPTRSAAAGNGSSSNNGGGGNKTPLSDRSGAFLDAIKEMSATEAVAKLEDVKEIAFHAEQAGLWAVAMRAYMEAADVELSLGRSTQSRMSLLLDAFNVYKCCEHDADERIVPFANVPAMLFPPEEEASSSEAMGSDVLHKVLLCEGGLPLEDIVMLNHTYESDLECVYNIFGNDSASMLLAAELHLHMVDLYMHSMGAHEQVPIILSLLGIVLKLFMAIRLCITIETSHRGSFNADDDFFVTGYSKTVNTREIERRYIARFLVNFLVVVLSYPPTTSTTRSSMTMIMSSNHIHTLVQLVRPVLESLPARMHSHVAWGSISLMALLQDGKITEAMQQWTTSSVLTSMTHVVEYMSSLGNEYSLMATAMLMHHVMDRCRSATVSADETTVATLVYAQCIERCTQQLTLWFEKASHCHHHYYHHLVMSLIPAMTSLVQWRRWDVLDQWFGILSDKFANHAVELAAVAVAVAPVSLSATNAGLQEEVLAAPRACVQHLRRWYLARKLAMDGSQAATVLKALSWQDVKESAWFFGVHRSTTTTELVPEGAANNFFPATTSYLERFGLSLPFLAQQLCVVAQQYYAPALQGDTAFATWCTKMVAQDIAMGGQAVAGLNASSFSWTSCPTDKTALIDTADASLSLDHQ